MPGPYTPPPASAVVSDELVALDPDTRHDATPVADTGATLAGYEPIDAPRAPSIGALEAPVAEPASTPAPTPVPTTAAPTPTATTSFLPGPVDTPDQQQSGNGGDG